MKILFALIILLSTSVASADQINYFPNKEDQTKVPEVAFVYLEFGRSITTDQVGQNSSNYLGALGYRRSQESFLYGAEYAYHFSADGMRYSNYDATIGYQPKVPIKVSPYVNGGFGVAASTDSKNEGRNGGSGINYFLDFGTQLFNMDLKDINVRTMTGIKFTNDTLTGGSSNKMQFTDFYFGVGVGW